MVDPVIGVLGRGGVLDNRKSRKGGVLYRSEMNRARKVGIHSKAGFIVTLTPKI